MPDCQICNRHKAGSHELTAHMRMAHGIEEVASPTPEIGQKEKTMTKLPLDGSVEKAVSGMDTTSREVLKVDLGIVEFRKTKKGQNKNGASLYFNNDLVAHGGKITMWLTIAKK